MKYNQKNRPDMAVLVSSIKYGFDNSDDSDIFDTL